jgi:hypothetical protein
VALLGIRCAEPAAPCAIRLMDNDAMKTDAVIRFFVFRIISISNRSYTPESFQASPHGK